jgi:hypothetical protein
VSKKALIGAIAASVLAVGAVAAVTATVIVDDRGGGGTRVVLNAPAPAPGLPPPGRGRGRGSAPLLPGTGPLPRLRGGFAPLLPGLRPPQGWRDCLQRNGLGRPGADGAPPLGALRSALRACRGRLPAPPGLGPRTP